MAIYLIVLLCILNHAAFTGSRVVFSLYAIDLGAHSFQTYRHVTFPLMRTALLAGGLLAFGLSFDEIVVTTFTSSAGLETLPLWIFNNLSRGEQAPIVTVVASAVMLLSIIPVWLAQRLTSGDGPVTGGTR